MATHSVNVIVKARDEASKKFGKIGQSAGSLSGVFKKLAISAGAYFGAREIKRFLSGSLDLYARQETAVRGLNDALNLLGKGGADAMRDMQQFASSIQKVTVHGDEAVLELMKMGASMGQLSGKELQDATKAAIGLAAAYSIDVVAAMRLVSRARVGDTASLTRYGIKLGEGLSAQEKFNRVLEIGAKNFALAEGEARTYSGSMIQMKNALGDIREEIAKGLAPMMMRFANRIKAIDMETIRTTGHFIKWTAALSAGVVIGPKIVSAIGAITTAVKGLAVGQTILQSLSGPAGIASLAAGVVVMAGTLGLVERAFGGINTELAETVEVTKKLSSELDNLQKKASMSWGRKALLVSPLASIFTIVRNLARGTQSGSKGLADITGKAKETAKSFEKLVDAGTKVAKTIKSITTPAPWKKIHDEMGKLKQSIVDFGKTKGQLLLERMKEIGYQEPSMAMVRKDLNQLKYLEDRKSRTEALTETAKDLRRELSLFGKDEFAAKLFDLRELGATEYQLRNIKRSMDELQRLKKGEKPEKLGYEFKQSLSVKEARLLTLAPGGRYNNTELYAKGTRQNTGQAVKLLAKIEKGIDKLKRPALGVNNLRIANFG